MAKNILDMVLWHPEMDFSKCSVTYIHRGAPGNLKNIQCNRITNTERGFLVLDDGTNIPCHRIIKIKYDDKILWNK
ncbi:DUF504 domain-containing protein [Methanobacterium sp. ACI-7]|uniref:DUF504 domain-containing protein n=1 Tax=unclassified Methanobacterium TaxID=2627676 RepID=UPI0039C30BFE